MLEVVQFRCPYTSMKYPQLLSNLRVESKLGDCGGRGGFWVGELQGFAGRAPSHVEPHIVTDGGGLELESKRFVWFQLSGDWARAEQQRPAKNMTRDNTSCSISRATQGWLHPA